MTQKELLYLEDAINHEKSIITICENTIKNLEDKKLISFLKNKLETHKNTYENLLNMLEVKANGW